MVAAIVCNCMRASNGPRRLQAERERERATLRASNEIINGVPQPIYFAAGATAKQLQNIWVASRTRKISFLARLVALSLHTLRASSIPLLPLDASMQFQTVAAATLPQISGVVKLHTSTCRMPNGLATTDNPGATVPSARCDPPYLSKPTPNHYTTRQKVLYRPL